MSIVNAENLFTLANIVFTIGTLLLVRKVITNRNRLSDFDITGAILTTTALVLMLAGYSLLGMGASLLFTLPTFLFWLFVSVYSIKGKMYSEESE